MPKKEWVAKHNGSEIRVTNTWTGGTKLYIDGDCRDTNNDMLAFSRKTPMLSARVTTANSEPFLVEVYIKALLTVKAKICVNGKQIGGDVF